MFSDDGKTFVAERLESKAGGSTSEKAGGVAGWAWNGVDLPKWKSKVGSSRPIITRAQRFGDAKHNLFRLWR